MLSSDDDSRKVREREFHNEAFAGDVRAEASKFYNVFAESQRVYRAMLQEGCKGRRFLEYGCGPGSEAFGLAAHGADVVGIDISDVAIEIAKEEARREGVTPDFRVMDAERLELEDASFDVVCGSGILHHLDLERAFTEISRVLKDEGRALFLEPLGHNPLIVWYRRRTPHMRSPDEHPLLASDVALARRYFENVSVKFLHLATLASVPLRDSRVFRPAFAALSAVDEALFAVFPPLRYWAWVAMLDLSKPRRRPVVA